MYQVPVDPTAVTGRRIAAWVIELVIAGVLSIIAFSTSVDGYDGIPGNLCDPQGDPPAADEVPICNTDLGGVDGIAIYDENTDESVFIESADLWIPWAIFVGYGFISFVLVEGLAGGSFAKLILGLRVVTREGTKAGVGRSFVRFLLWIVDGFPYCFPLVGLIAGLTTKGHQRIGDKAAGTFVVSANHLGHPLSIPGVTGPPSMPYGMPVSSPQPYAPPSETPWTPAPPSTPGPPGTPPAESAAGWAAPGATAPDAAASSAPGTGEAAGSTEAPGPQWDAERGTYIQWDVHRSAWLQWDADANEWRPIE